MCGRYQFTEPQNADLRRILQDVRRRCGDRAQDFRFGDVMPTAAAPVLIANGGKVVADLPDDQRPRRDGLRKANVPPQHGGAAVRHPGHLVLRVGCRPPQVPIRPAWRAALPGGPV